MQKIIDFFKSYWKEIVIVILVICCSVFVYNWYREKNRPPDVIKVPDTNANTLQQYFPDVSESTAKDMSHQIQRARETQAPTYRYYTISQAAADKQAQTYAKQQHADKIVKTTTEVPIVGDSNDKQKDSSVIENSFYAISLERKHRIKLGAEVVDGNKYVTLGYQNRDVEYHVNYSPDTQKMGAGVEVTVAKW